MRLLFLTNYFPPYHLGGYEELCADVAEGLEKKRHTIRVLTSHHGVRGQVDAESCISRALHLEVDSHPLGTNVSFFVGRNQRLQENIQCLEKTLASYRPDAIMVWGMWNLSRHLLLKAEDSCQRVVYYIADYWPTLPHAYVLHWQEAARRQYARIPKRLLGSIALSMLARNSRPPVIRFEHTICVSQALRNRLMLFSPEFEQARVIYNGIDLKAFESHACSRQPSRPLSLLYAGRLAPEKGVHTAIEALGLVVKQGFDVHLTIGGRGSREYQKQLENLAEGAGLSERITFKAYIPRTQMPETLKQFDALVVPSIWEEPLPRIIQEAMAAGLVVLATPVGGIPEIVMDGVNGLTFPPGDARVLSQQIERLLLDSALRDQLVERSSQTVRQRFDISRMVAELEQYLDATKPAA